VSILIDTDVFLRAVGAEEELSAAAREILDDPNEHLFFSAASAWEIAIRWSTGTLELPASPDEFIGNVLSASGLSQLPVSVKDAAAVAQLPPYHQDPFDRLLVAQARSNGLRLMTANPILEKYNVDVIALWLDDEDE